MKRFAFPRLAAVSAALTLMLVTLAATLAAAQDAPAAAKSDSAAVKPATPPASTTVAPGAKSAGKPAAAPVKKAPKAPKAPRAPKVKTPEKSWEEQKKEDGVWAKRTNWLTFGAGYAKRTGDDAGQGLGGYGIGFQRMLSRAYDFDAAVSHDMVGHFGNHFDEAVPFTLGFSRHFKWATPLRPYVGVGGGYYFRKFYRTGSTYNTSTDGGWYTRFGFASPMTDRHVLGFETRVNFVQGRDGITNPVFGTSKGSETIWTAQINWSLAY